VTFQFLLQAVVLGPFFQFGESTLLVAYVSFLVFVTGIRFLWRINFLCVLLVKLLFFPLCLLFLVFVMHLSVCLQWAYVIGKQSKINLNIVNLTFR
jgi:hypothetical protein